VGQLVNFYVLFLLRPFEKTFGKRLIKRPKLYFYDSGLVCYLLRLKKEEIVSGPERGHIFESFVIAEIIKQFYNKGEEPLLYFWRDKVGNEIDCIIKYGKKITAVEIKSGRTINKSFFKGLEYWKTIIQEVSQHCYVIYAGAQKRITGYKEVVSWQQIRKIIS
jgi:uncharacterized protein